jgi:hypothetical protein
VVLADHPSADDPDAKVHLLFHRLA